MPAPTPPESNVDIYGVPCDVFHVRTFRDGWQLGAGCDVTGDWSTFFVYDREDASSKWHRHCGPYSTFDQARDWILGIREAAL